MEGRFQDPADPKNGPHPSSRAVFAVPGHYDKPLFLADATGLADVAQRGADANAEPEAEPRMG